MGFCRLARRLTSAALALGLAVGVAVAAAPPASAASASITITRMGGEEVASGIARQYQVSVSCSSVDSSACTDMTVDIPLDTTLGMQTWRFVTQSAGISGAVTGGNTYTLTLPSSLPAGSVNTYQFYLVPPNFITPDGTSWSLLPTLRGTSIPDAVAPAPATGTARAKTTVGVVKRESTSLTTVFAGSTFSYTIQPYCEGQSSSWGVLRLGNPKLVDTLPAGLTYVSSSPQGTWDPVARTVTWDLADPAQTVQSAYTACIGPITGSTPPMANTDITITVAAPAAGTGYNGIGIVNPATISGLPLGAQAPISATSSWRVVVSDTPPVSGQILSKTGQGPIYTSGSSIGTFPGDWIPGAGREETSAEGWYITSMSFSGGGYAPEVVDPLPCLDNPIGESAYQSLSPSAGPCARPAFHATALTYTLFGLDIEALLATGWRPQAILTDGTTVPLELVSGDTGISRTFLVPSTAIGRVSTVTAPNTVLYANGSLWLDFVVWGYADASTEAGDILQDSSYGAAHFQGASTPLSSGQSRFANLFVVNPSVQTGIWKGAASSLYGSTVVFSWQLSGTFVNPGPNPTPGPWILSDLFPYEMTYSGADYVSVPLVRDGVTTFYELPVETIDNYQGTGRQLVRLTIPAAYLAAPGRYDIGINRITLPYTAPPGTYTNTIDSHVVGATQGPNCAGSGVFTPLDPWDTDGDGVTAEDGFCSYTAQSTVYGFGAPSFRLVKTVQGDLDDTPKYNPAVGSVSTTGGFADFTLRWINTGGPTLTAPVVYDILPRVGDTGVAQDQATVPRGSAFSPTLASVGAAPSGVTIAYSASANPCRDEVYPNAVNTTCVNDWTTDPATLGGLANMKALRLTAPSATYNSGQQFEVGFRMTIPNINRGLLAWNSAASRGTANGTPLLSAETPKVGLQAPPADPRLAVAKTATPASGGRIEAGGAITYTVTASNTGNLDLAPATVVDDLSDVLADATLDEDSITATIDGSAAAPATYDATTKTVTWSGALDVGQVVMISFDVTTASASAGAEIINRVTADATTVEEQDIDSNCVLGTEAGCSTTHIVNERSLLLTKDAGDIVDASGDGIVGNAGDTIQFSFGVTNTGNVALTGLVVTDAMAGPVTCALTALAAGQSTTCTADLPYPITATQVLAGVVDNIARASATDGQTPVESNVATTSTPLLVPGAISLTKSAGPIVDASGDGIVGNAGDTIVYSFVVTNTGQVRVTDVQVDDPLAGAVSCDVTTLLPEEQATCAAVNLYVLTQDDVDLGLIRNDATAQAVDPQREDVESNPAFTVTDLETTSSLRLTKSVDRIGDTNGDGVLQVGESVFYSFLVTNTGTVTLHAVSIHDDLLTAAGVAITCPSGPLAPGGTATCASAAFTVRATDVVDAVVLNTATAHAIDPHDEAVQSAPSQARVAIALPPVIVTPPTTPGPIVTSGPTALPSGPGGSMAVTGASPAPLLGAALLALAAGALLALFGRRRSH